MRPQIWFSEQRAEADVLRVWNRRSICGSTARLVSVLVGRVLEGEDPRRACADYSWEHDAPPDLASLSALIALREAVREFAANYPLREYADWKAVLKALRRADRAAGRRAR